MQPKPGVPERVRAQLDELTIIAVRRLEVLERPWTTPGEVDVTIVAEGDASWRTLSGEEKYEPRIVLTGEVDP